MYVLGQEPRESSSTIHFGATPCCANHQYTGSGNKNHGVDITDSFHNYRLDWDEKKMVFSFDGEPFYIGKVQKVLVVLPIFFLRHETFPVSKSLNSN